MAEERIPRRDLPPFEELEDANVVSAIREHGLIPTALMDSNQFGPQGMIIMLVITAVLTGAALGLMMLL